MGGGEWFGGHVSCIDSGLSAADDSRAVANSAPAKAMAAHIGCSMCFMALSPCRT